ncbi:MAG: FAD-dependent oxidoreductase [Clostridia bacterium]|nr:FAD-dependent oxidoreductase [Clostridia bacterium]MBQ3815734.1 FAD-dependent oxidoreductase [Clostridia bacterium]
MAKELTRDQKIFKLGKIITDRKEILLGLEKMSVNAPEYWGIDCGLQYAERRYGRSIADDCLDTALKMGKRKPKTFAQMKELTGYDDEHLTTVLEALCQASLVEWHFENLDGKNPNHERRWVLDMFVPGSAEIMVMRPEISPVTPQVADFFERMTYLPLAGITQMVGPGGNGIGMHVIPVEEAIPAECESLDVEHLSHWLKKYEGHLGVGICSCRKQQRIRGEGSGDLEQYWCIGVGDFADYCRETGMGHDITYDEAIEILKKAEEKGYVHQITNIDGENKIFGICNCAVGICNALRTSQLFNTPNMSRSAYISEVDAAKCVACGKCVEVCPAGAVRLGQKLCTTHGEIEYPRQELPDDHVWGEDRWNWNYKNENGVIQTWPTGTAPCKAACPLHIAIQGYIKMASEGRYREALELIKRDNPFPAVCGSICHKYCEYECTRGTVDDALAIDDIKQFIAAKDLESEYRYVPPMVSTTREKIGKKVAIIGSGPAGLSCAYFLAIEGYSPVVFEKAPVPGGMMTLGIPNFRLEKDVVNAEIDILREMGVEIRCGVEVGKDVTIPELREQGFEGFFLGIGLQYAGKLGIPGEDAEGVMGGVDFVKKVTLDDSFRLEGDVVVIGGGNIGADTARTAVRRGAKSVHLYCLESYDEMPMGEEDQELCKADGIVIHDGWGQTEVLTDENGRCKSIRFRKCLSVKNAEGRFAPTFDDNDTTEQPCTTVLFCIGQKPDWQTLLDGTKVELSPRGLVIADPVTLQTADPDIFAGGDIVSGQKFVVDALAMGREGAVSLHRYVNEGQSLTIHRNTRHFAPLNKDEVVVPEDKRAKPARQHKGIDSAKRLTMHDENLIMTEEQIKKEASRCLECGRSVVDPNKCIGCGMCTVQCKFDAIHLTRAMGDRYSRMIPAEQKFAGIGKHIPKRVAGIIGSRLRRK